MLDRQKKKHDRKSLPVYFSEDQTNRNFRNPSSSNGTTHSLTPSNTKSSSMNLVSSPILRGDFKKSARNLAYLSNEKLGGQMDPVSSSGLGPFVGSVSGAHLQSQNLVPVPFVDPRSKPLYSWSLGDFLVFLSLLNLGRVGSYSERAVAHEIDGQTLLKCDVRKLRGILGVEEEDFKILGKAVLRVRNREFLKEFESEYRDRLMFEYKTY